VSPAVAVSIDTTDVTLARTTAMVRFAFTEAPTDFSLADVTATGGTLSLLAQTAGIYTATFTATPGIDIGNATVSVLAGSWHVAGGIAGLGGSTAPFAVDTVTPTVAVSIDHASLDLVHNTATVTFAFSEAPVDFSSDVFLVADTATTGGTLSQLVLVDPTHYTATFTAAPGIDIGNATISVLAGSWHVAGGIAGLGGSTAPFTVDTVTPAVAVSIDRASLDLAHTTATVTFAFSEAPVDFSLADVAAAGGTVSQLVQVDPTHYTATFTAAPDHTIIGNATVIVTAGSWHEGNGNAGAGGSTAPFTIDTVSPAVASVRATPSTGHEGIGDTVAIALGHDTAAQALTGTAEKGSTVTVSDNGTQVGTTTADASTGSWSYTIGQLADVGAVLSTTKLSAALAWLTLRAASVAVAV
jgi:large repetitive protein